MKQGSMNMLRIPLDTQSIIFAKLRFTSFEMYSSLSLVDKLKKEV